MIFLGYSSKDRYTVVESMIFHLKNNGFHVWYDFHDMFLGDDRYAINFEFGIKNSKYVIFIISENLFSSKCAVEELDFAHDLYEQNEIVLFPILFNFTAENLPSQYQWVRKIIHNEVTDKTGTLYVVNQILERILRDQVVDEGLYDFDIIGTKLSEKHKYLCELIRTLHDIDLDNYNARLGILYSMYIYLQIKRSEKEKRQYCNKLINRIFSMTKLNIQIDHLTYALFQTACLILLNDFADNI